MNIESASRKAPTAWRAAVCVFLSILVIGATVKAQERVWSVSAGGSYTSGSELYYNPDNPDDVIRGLSYGLSDLFGVGLDVRRDIGETGIQVGLGAELLKRREAVAIPDAGGAGDAHDGFVVVPVEATAYFKVPFSTDSWEVLMGGGAGAYFGTRYYDRAGVTAESVERTPGLGIHVASEIQYNPNEILGVRFSMKFRNAHFRSVNRFTVPYAVSNGTPVELDQAAFASVVSVDGMYLGLSLVARF